MWSILFFFVEDRHCFGLQETKAASADACPNLHSNLEPVNPSLENHQKAFVETDHKDHNIVNILSFDAAETRQQTPGGLLPWISFGSQHILFIFLRHYLTFKSTKVIFFVNVDIVLVCSLQVTKAASAHACPNLHSKLSASPSLSRRMESHAPVFRNNSTSVDGCAYRA